MTVIQRLKASLQSAAKYNPESQVAPACILWTDPDKEFVSILPSMKEALPELLVYGEYDVEKLTGPAIWLRLALAGKVANYSDLQGRTPIIYLPGVSKQVLRSGDKCPDEFKPLVEMQYRGVLWTQQNGKDWTVYAFFKSADGGLGFDISGSAETQELLKKGLPRLLDERLEDHRRKKINQEYLSNLLAGEDPVKNLLYFLDHPEGFRSTTEEVQWQAFSNTCRKKYQFDPENDGVLTGAEKLNQQEVAWKHVWERLRENPKRYPALLDSLRSLSPPSDLFGDKLDWFQWNSKEEDRLKKELEKIPSLQPSEAITKIQSLERAHADRRTSIWTEIGESPLCEVLNPLASLAELIVNYITPKSPEELSDRYSNVGWQIDATAIDVMRLAASTETRDLVFPVLNRIYQGWLDDQARSMQTIIGVSEYEPTYAVNNEADTCTLFVDGLRMDLAHRLNEKLQQKGYTTVTSPQWSALPTLTASAKPAISPIRDKFDGPDLTETFQPVVKASGKSLQGGYEFKKALEQAGYAILGPGEYGSGKGKAWCEVGQFDHYGHEMGWKMVTQLDNEIKDVLTTLAMLFLNGWKKINIVTDHGWLLLPGGLPKVELPAKFSAHKWGRSALIKSSADSGENLYFWHWNKMSTFASARGIACYIKGNEYAHGGISPQECLTLNIEVSQGSAGATGQVITVEYVHWKGLRCHVRLSDSNQDITVDIRFNPAKDDTFTTEAKAPAEDGTVSLLMLDTDYEGKEAFIVVLDQDNQLLAQMKTTIGGNEHD